MSSVEYEMLLDANDLIYASDHSGDGLKHHDNLTAKHNIAQVQ